MQKGRKISRRTSQSKGDGGERKIKRGRRRIIEQPSFRNLPFVSFIPARVLLEECLECVEGACIVRRPSYMHQCHPSPSSSESTPSTLYLHSLFCVNPFVLALRPPSILASCIRSYDFAPLRIFAQHRRDRLLAERGNEEESAERREGRRHGRKGGGVRKVQNLEDEGNRCSLHFDAGGCFKKVDSRSESLFPPRRCQTAECIYLEKKKLNFCRRFYSKYIFH